MIEEEIERKRALERTQTSGPRQRIIEAYKLNNDINDAFAVMKEINTKIGKQAYTEDMIKAWILEYKNKSHDDGDDAR